MLELILLSATQGIFYQKYNCFRVHHRLSCRAAAFLNRQTRPSNSYPFVGAALQERVAMAAQLKMLYVALVILLALLNLTAGAAYVTAITGTQFAPPLG